jgi:hypothetical protein
MTRQTSGTRFLTGWTNAYSERERSDDLVRTARRMMAHTVACIPLANTGPLRRGCAKAVLSIDWDPAWCSVVPRRSGAPTGTCPSSCSATANAVGVRNGTSPLAWFSACGTLSDYEG